MCVKHLDSQNRDVVKEPIDVVKDVVKDGSDVVKEPIDVVKDGSDVVKDGSDVVKEPFNVVKDVVKEPVDVAKDLVDSVSTYLHDGVCRAIISCIEADPNVSAAQMATELHLSPRQILRYLKLLTDSRVIARVGGRKTGQWKIL